MGALQNGCRSKWIRLNRQHNNCQSTVSVTAKRFAVYLSENGQQFGTFNHLNPNQTMRHGKPINQPVPRGLVRRSGVSGDSGGVEHTAKVEKTIQAS